MVEEVAKGIYRIRVALPNNPLKELNSYFIPGESRSVLIDTGFRCEQCRESLSVSLDELRADRSRIDVLLTHLHSDHSGLSYEFAGKNRSIFIGEIDLGVLDYELFGSGKACRYQRYREEGFPTEALEMISAVNPSEQMALQYMDDRFVPLKNGDVIRAGPYTLQAILAPGHTPGHMMYWNQEQKIMFTGDHVLFDITPNIMAWNRVENSLGNYLDSLNLAKGFAVETAFPGHRKSGNYYNRIDCLITHHKRRFSEIIEILRATPGLTAYETAGLMRWKIHAKNWSSFPDVQKYFAVGECMAHLDYLLRRDQIYREMKAGVWRYYVK